METIDKTAQDSPTMEQYWVMRNHAVEQLKGFEKKLDQIVNSQPEIIKLAIKEHVNGKIDKLTQSVNDYIRLDSERNQRKDEEYAKRDEADKKWKDEVLPAIKTMQDAKVFTSIGGILIKGLVLIGAGVGTIFGLFNYIHK